MVPADSQQIPRAAATRETFTTAMGFRLPGSHRLRQTIPGHFTNTTVSHCCPHRRMREEPPQHRTQPPPGITCTRFSHPPRSLATTNGITYLFSLPTGTGCFTSPFPQHPMYSDTGDTTSLVPGFPIRTSSDPRSVDSSRGLSQPPTSFIGSQCQGIHHAPLNTYNTKP